MGRWGADQALAVVDSGAYVAPSGRAVDFARAIAAARDGTRLYRPGELPAAGGGAWDTRVEVTPEGTAQVGQRLVAEGESPVAVLNFASARNVGGGFLGGARAQEEDLCRASALYRCLERCPDYYAANRAHPDALYTDHLIWSPNVPFFRDDQGFVESPYPLSVITSPAPNTGAVLSNTPHLAGELRGAFARRAGHVLAVARAQGHEVLVLGAWGCGAFRGDPDLVADVFGEALRGPFAGAFRRVVFGVLVARRPDSRNLEAFARLAGQNRS